MKIKKYIEIPEEILVGLAEGRCVKGSLHRDQWTGRLTFKAYNCQPQKRPKDTLICPLETGWLKESRQRIKFYSSVHACGGPCRRMSRGRGSGSLPCRSA